MKTPQQGFFYCATVSATSELPELLNFTGNKNTPYVYFKGLFIVASKYWVICCDFALLCATE